MRIFLGATALAMTAGFAAAQDFILYGGAELEFNHEEFGPGTGTNSYFEGYLEAEFSGVYGGLTYEVANDDLLNEAEVYLGYRGALASGVEYTFYYTRYYYPNAGGDAGGEYSFELDVPFGEPVSVSLDLYYLPEFAGSSSLGSAYIGGAWAVTDAFEVSTYYGTYQVDGAGNEEEWELGATYYIGEETSVDLRWYDGSDETLYVDGYVGLALNWDTTLLGG